MTYSANANPNATNSELDSKRIITHKELTSLQRNELIDQYVEIQVDNMSMESLYEYAQLKLKHFYQNLSNSELKDEIDYYDDELYEELVDNVTTQTINQGGQF